MERRPKWAFHCYPWSDSLWQLQYHADIVDHILDPRRHDTSKIATPEPLSSATKPKYWDPTKTTAPPKQSLERAVYDEQLYQLAFGRVIRRAPSQDNMFLQSDGCDSPSLIYRTKPYEEQSVYAPRKESEKLHFKVLNATQFQFYKSAAEKESKSQNWLRVGSLFSDFVEASHRIEQGDVSESDTQGLSYQLEKRIVENQAGPVDERWSNQQLLRGRYYVDSIVKSMDPRTKFFRADLFIINRHNHPNPQSWGMDAFTTVIVRRKKPGDKPRNDKPCQVLMELSKFENLCPKYEDRQLLRMMLGRGDDLRSSSYLLSPYDAAKLSQSMLIIPRQEREVTVFKATVSGAPIGTVMVSTQNSDHRVFSDELPFPNPDQALARYDTAKPSSKDNQAMKTAVSTSASAHSTYKSASNGFPDLLTASNHKSLASIKEVQQGFTTQESGRVPSADISDGKVQNNGKVTSNGKVITGKVADDKVAAGKADKSERTTNKADKADGNPVAEARTDAVPKVSALPADPGGSATEEDKDLPQTTTMDKINLSLSHETKYSGPFERLQQAYSRIVDPIPHNSLENFPTWLYVFSNASQEAQQVGDKTIDFSPLAEMHDYADELPAGFPSLPVPQPEHTCAVDPRGTEPPHLVHPPMALASRLYDDYNSAEERDDHDLFQVFTPLNLSERSSPGSPMLFSGLETPDDDSESEECISPYPEPIPTFIDDSAPPIVMSTPQRKTTRNPGVPSELPSPRTFGPYQQGPPRHRFPEQEDFSMENGAAVHTCETHSQHLANLLFMFQSRIIHRGTRQELFILAMTYPATKMYLRSARCLRGLTEDQVKRVIGPFSQEQRAAYDAKFNPGRLEYTRRIEDYDRLYEICVPDTSADFEPIVPLPPAFKYMKEKELREILFNRQLPDPNRPRFGRTPSTAEYVTESITPSDASTVIYSTTTETTVSDINLEDYVLHHGTYSNGQSQTQHFLGEIWGPYFEGSVLKDIPLDVSFEQFIDELDSQMAHGPIYFVPGAAPVGAADPAAELSILWACQQLSIQGLVEPGMIAGDVPSGDNAEAERAPPAETGSPARPGQPGQAAGLCALSSHFAGQTQLLTELRRSQTVRSKTLRARYSLPTTVVLVPYGLHQSEATRLGQVSMDFQRSLVIHPVRKEMFLVAYDHSPETNNLFYRREYNQNLSKLPVHPDCRFGEVTTTLVDYVRFDAATETAFFPSGTLNKYFGDQLFPRSVTHGYKQFQRESKEDSKSAVYPGVINQLRGNVNVSLLPQTRLKNYVFLQKDGRYQDEEYPVQRPQVFYYSIRMLEPTYFGPLSSRPWVLLLSDVDVHSWTPLSALALLCAKMEILTKTMQLAPSDAVLDKVGVPHYQPTRPGLPDYFALSVSIGSFRPVDENYRGSKYFAKWRMRHNGRLLTTLFTGAVERISVTRAQREGINSASYEEAMRDQLDVAKYYETKRAPDGTMVRTRRADRFPKTLVGTYRPVYDEPKAGLPPQLLFFERILWPGIGFDYKVLNIEHPNRVPTMDDSDFDMSKGGPRLLLLQSHCIEKELYDSFVALPSFLLDNWDEMIQRARHFNSGSRALLRDVSLDPVDFSVEMLPPKWFTKFQRLRNFIGEDYYTALEKLVISFELDQDIRPPFQADPQNSKFLSQLHPYAFPHLECNKESFLRVSSQGYVTYRAEEHEVLRRMPSVLQSMKGYDVPQSGCCYARFYARCTVAERPKKEVEGQLTESTKPHSSLEFANTDEFL